MADKTKKCSHGREKDYCCLCHYGEIQQDRGVNNVKDALSQMKIGVGYRITKGFNLIEGKTQI